MPIYPVTIRSEIEKTSHVDTSLQRTNKDSLTPTVSGVSNSNIHLQTLTLPTQASSEIATSNQDPSSERLLATWGEQKQKEESAEKNTVKHVTRYLDGYFTPKKPSGYDDFISKITKVNAHELFDQQNKRTTSSSNPNRPLISTPQAIEAAASLFTQSLNLHANYQSVTRHINLEPKTGPGAESFTSRVYNMFKGATEDDATSTPHSENKQNSTNTTALAEGASLAHHRVKRSGLHHLAPHSKLPITYEAAQRRKIGNARRAGDIAQMKLLIESLKEEDAILRQEANEALKKMLQKQVTADVLKELLAHHPLPDHAQELLHRYFPRSKNHQTKKHVEMFAHCGAKSLLGLMETLSPEMQVLEMVKSLEQQIVTLIKDRSMTDQQKTKFRTDYLKAFSTKIGRYSDFDGAVLGASTVLSSGPMGMALLIQNLLDLRNHKAMSSFSVEKIEGLEVGGSVWQMGMLGMPGGAQLEMIGGGSLELVSAIREGRKDICAYLTTAIGIALGAKSVAEGGLGGKAEDEIIERNQEPAPQETPSDYRDLPEVAKFFNHVETNKAVYSGTLLEDGQNALLELQKALLKDDEVRSEFKLKLKDGSSLSIEHNHENRFVTKERDGRQEELTLVKMDNYHHLYTLKGIKDENVHEIYVENPLGTLKQVKPEHHRFGDIFQETDKKDRAKARDAFNEIKNVIRENPDATPKELASYLKGKQLKVLKLITVSWSTSFGERSITVPAVEINGQQIMVDINPKDYAPSSSLPLLEERTLWLQRLLEQAPSRNIEIKEFPTPETQEEVLKKYCGLSAHECAQSNAESHKYPIFSHRGDKYVALGDEGDQLYKIEEGENKVILRSFHDSVESVLKLQFNEEKTHLIDLEKPVNSKATSDIARAVAEVFEEEIRSNIKLITLMRNFEETNKNMSKTQKILEQAKQEATTKEGVERVLTLQSEIRGFKKELLKIKEQKQQALSNIDDYKVEASVLREQYSKSLSTEISDEFIDAAYTEKTKAILKLNEAQKRHQDPTKLRKLRKIVREKTNELKNAKIAKKQITQKRTEFDFATIENNEKESVKQSLLQNEEAESKRMKRIRCKRAGDSCFPASASAADFTEIVDDYFNSDVTFENGVVGEELKLLKIAQLSGELSEKAFSRLQSEGDNSADNILCSKYFSTLEGVELEQLVFPPTTSKAMFISFLEKGSGNPVGEAYLKLNQDTGSYQLFHHRLGDLSIKSTSIREQVLTSEFNLESIEKVNEWMKTNNYKAKLIRADKVSHAAETMSFIQNYSELLPRMNVSIEGNKMIIKAPGESGLTFMPSGMMSASELHQYIEEHYHQKFKNLVKEIELQSSRSADGDSWYSQAQALADLTDKVVLGYKEQFIDTVSSRVNQKRFTPRRDGIPKSLTLQMNLLKSNGEKNKIALAHPDWQPDLKSSLFAKDPVMPRKTIKPILEEELAAIKEVEAFIYSNESIKKILKKPANVCDETARRILEMLNEKPEFSDVNIVNIAMWPKFLGDEATYYANHYAVRSTYKGLSFIIDPTAGQFKFLGEYSGPLIATENNWLAIYQAAFDRQKSTLVKIAFIDSMGRAPYHRPHELSGFSKILNLGVEVLSEAPWYSVSAP